MHSPALLSIAMLWKARRKSFGDDVSIIAPLDSFTCFRGQKKATL